LIEKSLTVSFMGSTRTGIYLRQVRFFVIIWTEGKLVFRNDPLDVVVRRLERWYNIEVEMKGDVPKDLRLHVTFVNEELEEVLGLLKRSLPIDYKIENFNLKPDETYEKKKVIITLKRLDT
jgi:transmembrane sensor